MTLFVPLDISKSTQLPPSPPFLRSSTKAHLEVERVAKAILKAKRIVVVCGAGISVQAGIPCFRSQDGLFHTLKRENPKEALSSGKDLFDASVFHPGNTTALALFYQMIARLSTLSSEAQPTQFHQLLRILDERGQLLRAYTQNIDALEEKTGLSFGVPTFQPQRSRSRKSSPNAHPPAVENIASTSRLSIPSTETPRCIPLHGTLKFVHCNAGHSFALADHLALLANGTSPACPECISLDETRHVLGKRSRGIGRLRPSVVLYNEQHKDGEGVGDVVQRDLLGLSKGKGRSGADLLLVVGTSLRVPGTKRMVREFSKAVRSRAKDASGAGAGSASSSPAPGHDDPPIKSIYLDLDFPVPTREWDGVFDVWLQGDAQVFADMLQTEIDKQARAKEVASEKKRRREEQQRQAEQEQLPACATPEKRKPASPAKSGRGPKRRKVATTPTTKEPDATPKLVLRIPSKAARRKLIPEVVITRKRPPPTPGKPPSYSLTTTPIRLRGRATPTLIPDVDSDSEDGTTGVLPSLIRNLRSRSSSLSDGSGQITY